MGSDTGLCDVPEESDRLIRLSAGTYPIVGFNLAYNVSIEGAGESETVLEGTVFGLRTSATLSHVTVTGGTETGGIRVGPGESPVISHCTIRDNTAYGAAGGGVSCGAGSSPTFLWCTISANLAWSSMGPGFGGGIACSVSSPTFTNCTVKDNSAYGGGGVYCRDSAPTFTNCTIAGNDGGGFYSSSSS